MVQSAPKVLTVDEFISHYGECDRDEIIDGELILTWNQLGHTSKYLH